MELALPWEPEVQAGDRGLAVGVALERKEVIEEGAEEAQNRTPR